MILPASRRRDRVCRVANKSIANIKGRVKQTPALVEADVRTRAHAGQAGVKIVYFFQININILLELFLRVESVITQPESLL